MSNVTEKTTLELERDGGIAFANGTPASDCPYSFIRSPFWKTQDHDRFKAEWLPKLNAWTKGWLAAQRRSR